ncbi:hypothetical protein HOLleu_35578 [Holothuria leucospilota]|uniref:Uncharacterized protein n=1 Tax=Holothuria leucospilota TaxID=206669 RepID=A0A9Q0YIN4_HOLLE|nr:hypothetical protein HOLleu_35578 [Holothuria leucospilota]
MRIARWACRLMKYNYEMVFTKGSENVIADSMSRVPVQGTDECITDDDQEIICQVLWEQMKTRITLSQLQESSRLHPSFQIIRKYIIHGWPRFNQVNECAIPYYLVRDELCLVDDVMLRGEKVVIPSALTQHVLAFAHEAHQGMSRFGLWDLRRGLLLPYSPYSFRMVHGRKLRLIL